MNGFMVQVFVVLTAEESGHAPWESGSITQCPIRLFPSYEEARSWCEDEAKVFEITLDYLGIPFGELHGIRVTEFKDGKPISYCQPNYWKNHGRYSIWNDKSCDGGGILADTQDSES